MALLFCGIALGFVLSTALFIQKIWQLRDEVEYYRARARVAERMLKDERKDRMEWAKIRTERTAR